MWFKALISAAAVAIIGYVGFFAYERITAYYDAAEATEQRRCNSAYENFTRMFPTDPGYSLRQESVARCRAEGRL